MSSREDLSFRSESNIYELNSNNSSITDFNLINSAQVEFPITTESYFNSIKHYRFKIEKLFGDAKAILNAIIESPKQYLDNRGNKSIQGSLAAASVENSNFQTKSDSELTKLSYKFYFKDLNRSLSFSSLEEVNNCLKFIEDAADVSVMLPELAFDSKISSLMYQKFGKVLRSGDFSNEIAKSRIQVHFPSDCYSYTIVKDVQLGCLRNILVYVLLAQLIKSQGVTDVPDEEIEFKATGRVTGTNPVHFLDKSFATIYLGFSMTPQGEIVDKVNQSLGCLHILMTTKPLELVDIAGFEQVEEPIHKKIIWLIFVSFKKSTHNNSSGSHVKASRGPFYAARQIRYATGSITRLFHEMDIDGDSKLSISDIVKFAKHHAMQIDPAIYPNMVSEANRRKFCYLKPKELQKCLGEPLSELDLQNQYRDTIAFDADSKVYKKVPSEYYRVWSMFMSVIGEKPLPQELLQSQKPHVLPSIVLGGFRLRSEGRKANSMPFLLAASEMGLPRPSLAAQTCRLGEPVKPPPPEDSWTTSSLLRGSVWPQNRCWGTRLLFLVAQSWSSLHARCGSLTSLCLHSQTFMSSRVLFAFDFLDVLRIHDVYTCLWLVHLRKRNLLQLGNDCFWLR